MPFTNDTKPSSSYTNGTKPVAGDDTGHIFMDADTYLFMDGNVMVFSFGGNQYSNDTKPS